MSWRKISIKFAGNCTVCGKALKTGETGLWAKGLGIKHESCAKPEEIACTICKNPAGCGTCEFADECDIGRVSPACICRGCLAGLDPLAALHDSVRAKYPALRPQAAQP